MLALIASLSLLAAPRGLPASTPVEFVTQVEARLPKWLTHGGDRKALLANAKELEALVATFPLNPADVKGILKGLKADQALKPERTTFAASRALVVVDDRQTVVSLFEGTQRCEVALFAVPAAGSGRHVIVSGPLTDERPFEKVVERSTEKTVTLLEKRDGAWTVAVIPPPPPPDCTAKLKRAAKDVYIAEKSYFAEFDGYGDALDKLGIDPKAMGVTSVKVTLKGAGPTGGFSADVALEDGVARVTDASGEVTIVKPCTR